jgi:YHS domain-containing protein
MKFLFVEIIFPLLVLLFLRALLKNIFASFRSASAPRGQARPAAPPISIGGELKKDPVCGTYVSTVGSVSQKVNGQLVYFCSTACRDKYRAA